MGWHLTEYHLNSSDFGLEKVNQEILVNESINNQTLAGVIFTPPDSIVVCGGQHFPWAYECLDTCQIGSQCLLGGLTVRVNIIKQRPPLSPTI